MRINELQGARVLVTGGAGFIGSSIVHSLSPDNEVTVLDDLSSGTYDNIADVADEKTVTFVKGSITDTSLLAIVCNNVDYIFHLAACASVPKSISDPKLNNEVNITGTLNILEAARKHDVKKVVFSSSAAVYGNTSTLPIHESTPFDPLSPYAASKIMGEYYCSLYARLYDLPTVALRYFNVYGPRQDPNSDYAAAIPHFIYRTLASDPPVIYGDGTQTRDFVYVEDVVRANILAALSDRTGAYNIAGGTKTSVNDLAMMICDITGIAEEPMYAEERPGDIKHSYADITRAREELGFEPTVELKEGLKKTVDWFSSLQ
jgi:UDP-glucose 4-epimerase